MFMLNDVYQWDKNRIRVLWTNLKSVIWIDIDDTGALPQIASKSDLKQLMSKGDLQSIADPFIDISMKPPKKKLKAEEVQKKAWSAIKGAVKSEPEVYQRMTRGPLLNKVLQDTGATK